MTKKFSWLLDVLLILVLVMAGYLRLAGYDWGEGYHQHPDELFLTGVLENLRAHTCEDKSIPVDLCPDDQKRWMNIGEYFNTAESTLNPYNRGNAFYVYGDLPMTLIRVAMESLGPDIVQNTKFFARQISAYADLFTIFVLYLLVSNLYNRKVGLLASLFSSLAVMQIQQSHYFTTDLFMNLFMFMALSFAVKIIGWKPESRDQRIENEEEQLTIDNYQLSITNSKSIITHPLFILSIGFGFSLGMAMASKVNAAAMAIVLPGAFAVLYLANKKNITEDILKFFLVCLIAGGFATIISFRIFQPYAFDGIGINQHWLENIGELRAQSTGKADLPWNLQWARRSHLYSFINLTVWGLGLPLGILAWVGFLLMGWRILNGEYKHLLLWGWTAFYFIWQSLQFNPTMRYQLPIYPLLCMMAAWAITEFRIQNSKFRIFNYVLPLAGVVSLALTAVWAFAFQSIYVRDETRIAASRWIFQNIAGPVNLKIETTDEGVYNQPIPMAAGYVIQPGMPYNLSFVPNRDGQISEVLLGHAKELQSAPIVITIVSSSEPDVVLARASELVDSTLTTDPRGPSVTLTLDRVVSVKKGELYTLRIETLGTGLTISGSNPANETDYDWSLPFRIDGYDSFGGIYRGDLILQVYWADDANKLLRFEDTLSQADYIIIPTNHQYGQITRLPERYPLTTLYYRELLGCPADEDIIKCYNKAEPGRYNGNLGFELIKTFESYPTLGNLVINDQAAEEAFTFYDHPKVLIFKKTDDFSLSRVHAVLSAADLTKAVPLAPTQFKDYKTLMLPDTRLASQRVGGTWSQLFSYDWIQNKYPGLGALIWYLFIFVLGLFAYPLTRLALPGLKQYTYPLSRTVGLVLLAWLAWFSGSVGVTYSRVSISMAAALIAVSGFGLWMNRRQQFKDEWNANRRFFVTVEIVFLVFFLIDLLIRLGNPDLWHPSKGGERPMDFSYFNAVLKSTSFPPYDPWYAGGYINYYYYGFVIAGTPVKLLGIVPSIAYNLILPTWFALIAVGAFAIGWNLFDGFVKNEEESSEFNLQLITGLSASLMTVLIGNLGTIRLLFNGFARVAAPGGLVPADASIFQVWGWSLKGMIMSFSGSILPIGRGDWYWFPSRVIPAPGDVEPITEFPLFTFLYSDMHAHMLVMPITLFIIAWAVSVIKSRATMTRGEWIAAFGVGALMVGALKPTNTWDLYTYFPLAAIALAYTLFRHVSLPKFGESWITKAIASLGAVVGLYALGVLLYYPFTYWYGQSYGSVIPWYGSHTPISSYLTQWGLFLFLITAWLAWETRNWMEATPVSRLGKLRDYVVPIEIAIAAFIALLVFFAVEGVHIGWLALPIAAWAGILLLRSDIPDEKRAVLLMVGTALTLTMAVELVVLVGDIGRMNTVFKLYLQAWMLLSVSAAASLGWLLDVFASWRTRWRTIFQSGTYLLLIGVFMFTLTATSDKISDRLTPPAPHTLDSMTFMKYSALWDGENMDLSQDYNAIRWMQDNIQGSPVIVEANCTEYRWCTRFTIYTGLPGVVGWNWHQRQQRGIFAPQVQERVNEVGAFYTTLDEMQALSFIKKYDVKYIVVGQLERNIYPAIDPQLDGLVKFSQFDGKYWKTIYHEGSTTIYEVMQ